MRQNFLDMTQHFASPLLLRKVLSLSFLLSAGVAFQACDKDDPEPVHEPEVITTVEVTLVPTGGGIPITLKFFDADGEQGSIAPLTTVSGNLEASTTYSAVIELSNETVNPVADVTAEVAEEGEDHLFCFDTSENITVEYADEDASGLPLGILTIWTTGTAGEAAVTLSLRHQPGTKTGECPGSGESDAEVTFDLTIN